ncbi:hypothetical protein PGT21_004096 [Puccinia graminis f. sp. tritici]|uniref:Uncharacterized protein n=1 Tax=Puccinia graminis f. sp. tritici TaxID=56615 RepID=A0A5B0MJJ5_PUCGR|nr:hypothetical protein PGT21_004096 [Puccinia graminis f. sp. tritici]
MAQHYHQSHALRLFAAGGNQINLCKDFNTATSISISPISTRRIQALENYSLSSLHRFSSEGPFLICSELIL